MRAFRLYAPNRRIAGRHRRQRAHRDRRPWSAVAITAVVALGLVAIAAADHPATSASQRVGADAVHVDESLKGFLEPAHLEAVPVGPEPVAEPVQAVLSGARVIEILGESGIPDVALRAYMQAESRLASNDVSCGVPWTLLAAIGRVESNHGRFGGAQLREDGYGTRPIRGIPLDGRPNVALIRDTDGGALDGDTTYDRAVGPMQFIPSTWRSVSADANSDGRRDPNNIFDAAQGAAVYLCAGDTDLRDRVQAARAVRRYNNADEYVRIVLSLAQQYQTGRTVAMPPPSEPSPDDWPAADNARPPSSPRPSTSATPSTPPASEGTAPPDRPTQGTAPTPPAEETATGEPVPAEEAATGAPVPAEETATGEPATAAVGWAPAMRDAVLSVLQESSDSVEPQAVCTQGADRPPVAGSEAAPPSKESPSCKPEVAPTS